jgi:hypothetical protein
MSNLSPNPRLSLSPGSSNDDLDQNTSPPPPLQMPPEIRIFQQKNFDEKGLNNNTSDAHQTPTLRSKKSFCIEALLAKNQNENFINANELESHSLTNTIENNNYPDDQLSR